MDGKTRENTDRAFNVHKENTLKRIDKSITNDFREVGFGKWGKLWLPIIQLNPFDVNPGYVRDEWEKTYQKVNFPFCLRGG